MRFALRCDASADIGFGHGMRCLALAEQLLDNNHSVEIFYYEMADEILAKMPSRVILVELDEPSAVPILPGRITVIDSYTLKHDAALQMRDDWWFLRHDLKAVRKGRTECRKVLVSFGGSAGAQAKVQTDEVLPGIVVQPATFALYATQLDWADVVIGAAGVSSWERAYLGIPTLITPVAQNQLSNYQAFTRALAAIPIGAKEESLPAAIRWLEILNANPDLVAMVSQKASAFVPGDSFSDFWRAVKTSCLV